MSNETAVAIQPPSGPSLLAKFASRFGVEPNKLMTTLKATAFKGDVSNEQLMALLIVADQYRLNPWTKEIYAFPDRQNGIVPVIGVDGWARIINEHPQFDGVEFEETDGACTCVIYRKDRSHAVRVTEYLAECRRDTGPWKTHPRRLLRHKSLIQAARLAFGFVGIFDQDEAERIIEKDVTPTTPATIANINARIAAKQDEAQVIEAVTFAQVADGINKASDADALGIASDLIRSIGDEQQRVELIAMAQERKRSL